MSGGGKSMFDHLFMRSFCMVCAIGIGLLLIYPTQIHAAQVCNINAQPSTPDSDFTVHDDEIVTHNKTGLMWARNTYFGIQYGGIAGYDDWRIPNVKELETIVENRCMGPALNLNIFYPNTDFVFVNTSTPVMDTYQQGSRWYYDFKYGSLEYPGVYSGRIFMFVRGGQ